MGDTCNLDKEKYGSPIFSWGIQYGIQNISIHGSKVILCKRKRDEWTKERTNERTNQKQYAPNFFQSWGHKNILSASFTYNQQVKI